MGVEFTLDLHSVDKCVTIISPDHHTYPTRFRERRYTIVAFEPHTYELSRIYLARWNIYLTMRSIADVHPMVPKWQRTPRWFVSQYMNLYRSTPGNVWGRVLGLPDRGQRHANAPELGEFVNGEPTLRPRHLRTLGEREVAMMFGSHVEWIILQFHVYHKHVIDMPSWLDFAEETFRARHADESVARRDGYEGDLGSPDLYEVDVRSLRRCRNKTYPAPGVPVEDELMVSV